MCFIYLVGTRKKVIKMKILDTEVTDEEIIELFRKDETDFLKAVDKLCERIITEHNTRILMDYLKGRGII